MPRAYEFVLDVLYFNTPILFGLYTVYIQNSLTNQDDNHIFEEHLWSRKINPCRDGLTIFRSSRLEVFCKKRVLRPATLLKKSLWHRCFPVNFAKFIRTPFFTEHLRWLILYFTIDASGYITFKKHSPEVFCKKGVLKNLAKITGNTCARASCLIKLLKN